MSFKTIVYVLIILLLTYLLFTVGFSLLLAFLLALLLEPIIIYISRKFAIKRVFVSVLVCGVFTMVVLALGYLLVAKVAAETAGLLRTLLSFTRDLGQTFDALYLEYRHLFDTLSPEYQYNLQQVLKSLLASLQDLLVNGVTLSFNAARMVPNFFFELLIVFIAMFLISLRLPNMKDFFLQFFDPSDHPRLDKVMQQLHKAVFGFLQAQIIISIAEFFFVLIGFLILGVKYPSATALLVTLVDIMPVLGTGAVMIPMAIYQYAVGDIFLGTGLLIHYTIIIVFRRILDPKIMAESIGISALSALASMYLGVKLAGFVGLFLGPSVVILFQAMLRVGIIKIKIKF